MDKQTKRERLCDIEEVLNVAIAVLVIAAVAVVLMAAAGCQILATEDSCASVTGCKQSEMEVKKGKEVKN